MVGIPKKPKKSLPAKFGMTVVNVAALYLFLASCLAMVVAAVTTVVEVIVMVARNGWSRSRKDDER